MEASGMHAGLERLLAELNFEVVDRDATRSPGQHEQAEDGSAGCAAYSAVADGERFPKNLVPRGENRDLRQLLWHRHRMVHADRIMNQLQAVALNEGLRCKRGCGGSMDERQLESFRLAPWASGDGKICCSSGSAEPNNYRSDARIGGRSEKCPEARRLRRILEWCTDGLSPSD